MFAPTLGRAPPACQSARRRCARRWPGARAEGRCVGDVGEAARRQSGGSGGRRSGRAAERRGRRDGATAKRRDGEAARRRGCEAARRRGCAAARRRGGEAAGRRGGGARPRIRIRICPGPASPPARVGRTAALIRPAVPTVFASKAKQSRGRSGPRRPQRPSRRQPERPESLLEHASRALNTRSSSGGLPKPPSRRRLHPRLQQRPVRSNQDS